LFPKTKPLQASLSEYCYTTAVEETLHTIQAANVMQKLDDLFEIIERHPTKVSGAWVFRGTRVPVAALFENLKDGASIDQFLEWFPGVTRAQVEALLDREIAQLTQMAQE
jgi:uncharacterized protein (DUF433 family)